MVMDPCVRRMKVVRERLGRGERNRDVGKCWRESYISDLKVKKEMVAAQDGKKLM